jgi:hypothetical protein
MNPLHTLTTRGVSLAVDRTLDPDRPTGSLYLTAGAVIALPTQTAVRGIRLARKILVALGPAAEKHRLGPCAACGAPVTESDPFIRYHGEYYHAHSCAESNPPALKRRQVRARVTST